MTEKKKDIYDMFNIEPVKEITENAVVQIESPVQYDSYEADFEEARKNYIYLINTAKEALEDAHAVAKEKESGKEYEAVNGLLNTVAKASSDLLKLHQMKKKYREAGREKDTNDKNGIAVNNAVFIGSSSELRKLLGKGD